MGVLVLTSGGSPLGPGRQSRTAQAQDAIGVGEPLSSTRHMRQFPAIESRSWKQKRGISAPAASHAWSSVYSAGTSMSLPSTMSLFTALLRRDLRSFLMWIGGIGVNAALDLVPEVTDEALHWPSRAIAERADGMALDLGRDLHQHVDLSFVRAALGHAGQHAPHPSHAFTAGRTLAAALMLVEI